MNWNTLSDWALPSRLGSALSSCVVVEAENLREVGQHCPPHFSLTLCYIIKGQRSKTTKSVVGSRVRLSMKLMETTFILKASSDSNVFLETLVQPTWYQTATAEKSLESLQLIGTIRAVYHQKLFKTDEETHSNSPIQSSLSLPVTLLLSLLLLQA